EEDQSRLLSGVRACDLDQPPVHWIREYAVLELLGTGAFGQVYKARKETKSGQPQVYAIKEVNTTQAIFGRTEQERQQSVRNILNEVNIIKQQLRHPNIVRYYKTFLHGDRLYIVMEMLEGLPLTELISSMKEKNEHFTEDRIWHVFTQLVLALRYLHREKAIVHRDLSSNNIMIGEGDKATITDFGLAKQKLWDSSKMTSSVGTLVFSCPEIVQNQPYGEGADIWSLGCILYQMCTYTPPFQAECILTVASRIVGGQFEPLSSVSKLRYSEMMENVVRVCLTSDPQKRPDIIDAVTQRTTDTSRPRSMTSEVSLLHRQWEQSECLKNEYIYIILESLCNAWLQQILEYHIRHVPVQALFTRTVSSPLCHKYRRTTTIDFLDLELVLDSVDYSPSWLCVDKEDDTLTPTTAVDVERLPESRFGFLDTPVDNVLTNLNTSCTLPEPRETPPVTIQRPSSSTRVAIPQHCLRPVNDPILDVVGLIRKLEYVSFQCSPSTRKHCAIKQFVDKSRGIPGDATTKAYWCAVERTESASRMGHVDSYSCLQKGYADALPKTLVLGFNSIVHRQTRIDPTGSEALREASGQPLVGETDGGDQVTYRLVMTAIEILLRECGSFYEGQKTGQVEEHP
ncbi:serine/threonine-protein kinase Nek10, partial [Clonorchis sinensis]